MPLARIHLISLTQTATILDFLKTLHSTNVKPLVISKVIRWIILPEKIDVETLLRPRKPWDLLLITLESSSTKSLPPTLTKLIECHWTTLTGIPSRLTNTFDKTNSSLLHPNPATVPPLSTSLENPAHTSSTSQTLELSPGLIEWIKSFAKVSAGRNAVSMLNLLSFNQGMKDSYLVYGKAFADSIGSSRGGNAKLVGNIVASDSAGSSRNAKTDQAWDEFALAHYPSILHFAEMLASKDYQEVNLKNRVPALFDTCILCTSEIEIEDLVKGQGDMGIGQRAMERRETKL